MATRARSDAPSPSHNRRNHQIATITRNWNLTEAHRVIPNDVPNVMSLPEGGTSVDLWDPVIIEGLAAISVEYPDLDAVRRQLGAIITSRKQKNKTRDGKSSAVRKADINNLKKFFPVSADALRKASKPAGARNVVVARGNQAPVREQLRLPVVNGFNNPQTPPSRDGDDDEEDEEPRTMRQTRWNRLRHFHRAAQVPVARPNLHDGQTPAAQDPAAAKPKVGKRKRQADAPTEGHEADSDEEHPFEESPARKRQKSPRNQRREVEDTGFLSDSDLENIPGVVSGTPKFPSRLANGNGDEAYDPPWAHTMHGGSANRRRRSSRRHRTPSRENASRASSFALFHSLFGSTVDQANPPRDNPPRMAPDAPTPSEIRNRNQLGDIQPGEDHGGLARGVADMAYAMSLASLDRRWPIPESATVDEEIEMSDILDDMHGENANASLASANAALARANASSARQVQHMLRFRKAALKIKKRTQEEANARRAAAGQRIEED